MARGKKWREKKHLSTKDFNRKSANLTKLRYISTKITSTIVALVISRRSFERALKFVEIGTLFEGRTCEGSAMDHRSDFHHLNAPIFIYII